MAERPAYYMKTRRHHNCLLVLVALLSLCNAATATTFSVNSTDQGWYNGSGTHYTGSTNSIAALFGGIEYRTWFKFVLPADCAISVNEATFVLNSVYPSRGAGAVPHNVNITSVQQGNIANIGVTGNSVAIFNDLGDGVIGNGTVASNGNFSLTTPLSGTALTDIQTAAGTASRQYAIGIRHTPVANSQYIMGYSSAAAVTGSLTVVCNEATTLVLFKKVDNTQAGSATVEDFDISIDGVEVVSGAVNDVAPNTNLVISELDVNGYEEGTWFCEDANNQTSGLPTNGNALSTTLRLAPASAVTCSITNTGQLVDLSVVKSVSEANPNVGDEITFILTVNNTGPHTATGIQITDNVKPGFVYTPGSMIGGDIQLEGTPLTWTINSLASGGTEVLTFKAVVQNP